MEAEYYFFSKGVLLTFNAIRWHGASLHRLMSTYLLGYCLFFPLLQEGLSEWQKQIKIYGVLPKAGYISNYLVINTH